MYMCTWCCTGVPGGVPGVPGVVQVLLVMYMCTRCCTGVPGGVPGVPGDGATGGRAPHRRAHRVLHGGGRDCPGVQVNRIIMDVMVMVLRTTMMMMMTLIIMVMMIMMMMTMIIYGGGLYHAGLQGGAQGPSLPPLQGHHTQGHQGADNHNNPI